MIHTLPKLNANAVKFALMIGSLVFTLNHGSALIKGEMTAYRWFSATLGYLIPLATSLYCPCAQRPARSALRKPNWEG